MRLTKFHILYFKLTNLDFQKLNKYSFQGARPSYGATVLSVISLHMSTYSSRLHVRWSIPQPTNTRNLQPHRQLKACSQNSVGLTTQNGMWINMLFKGCGDTSSFGFLPLGCDLFALGPQDLHVDLVRNSVSIAQ